jgi:hypothetical protein
MRQVALYTRVSTDIQTTEKQERELRTIAARAGWNVINVHREATLKGRGNTRSPPREPGQPSRRGSSRRPELSSKTGIHQILRRQKYLRVRGTFLLRFLGRRLNNPKPACLPAPIKHVPTPPPRIVADR